MTLDVRPFIATLNRENNPLLNCTPRITVQSVASAEKWTPVLIWQFTASEARSFGVEGQGNCFVVPLDRSGTPMYGRLRLFIATGWEGMRPDETPQPQSFEKQFPEPAGNVSLFGQAKYWIEIDDRTGTPSDRVVGITLANPSDMDPNAHHCTLVVFQIQRQDEQRPDGGTVSVSLAELRRLQKQVQDVADALNKLG